MRHADFMEKFFRDRGVRAVAVHSGPRSAPRTQSLEQLESGELQIIFAVDMFNEGVDVPAIDTVLMLRPTESKILWLQQFGRGLRKADDKPHLSVIDYIGNHRTFLQVPMILLPGAGTRPGEVRMALRRLEHGELELPQDAPLSTTSKRSISSSSWPTRLRSQTKLPYGIAASASCTGVGPWLARRFMKDTIPGPSGLATAPGWDLFKRKVIWMTQRRIPFGRISNFSKPSKSRR
ncbi:MAG: hypothetical protein IPL00_10490 [Gammaproteobacteria bacterium]|nr:hypothetical protein [Gammaproteobacteria bacterium]